MAKVLIFLMLAGAKSANAVVGESVYEAAATSAAVSIVALSSGVAALVSPGPADRDSGLPIVWYSLTMFNMSASTAAYTFHSSSFTAPGLTCANGAPIGGGTEASPWSQLEQFTGFYLWGTSCKSTGGFDIKVVRRGR